MIGQKEPPNEQVAQLERMADLALNVCVGHLVECKDCAQSEYGTCGHFVSLLFTKFRRDMAVARARNEAVLEKINATGGDYRYTSHVYPLVRRWLESQGKHYEIAASARDMLPDNHGYIIFVELQADFEPLARAFVHEKNGVYTLLAPVGSK